MLSEAEQRVAVLDLVRISGPYNVTMGVAFAIFQAIMLWEYSLKFRPEIETLGMVGTANLGSWNGHGRNMDNITMWCNYCNMMIWVCLNIG